MARELLKNFKKLTLIYSTKAMIAMITQNQVYSQIMIATPMSQVFNHQQIVDLKIRRSNMENLRNKIKITSRQLLK